MRQTNTLLVGSILLLGLFHLATLRPGHDWGDDFSLYVAHARNLAEGRPYADTGYIYNPHFPVLSPRTYPPVFPILLVPVYQLFGMNLMAMKAFLVLLFMAFLAVLALLLYRHLPVPYAVGCLWLVGLNPFIWQHKDRLLSEVPFMLFAYLALFFMDCAVDADGPRQRGQRLLWGLLSGVTAYLAFGTRTVGVVLLPALFVCQFARFRRLSLLSLWALLPFGVLVLLQKMLLPTDASYLDQLEFDLGLFAQVGVDLVKAMGMFFDNGYLGSVRLGLFCCLLLLAGVGFVDRMRERQAPHAFFAIFSFLLLVFWPYADWQRRYLMPILPLFFYYACEGLRRLGTFPHLIRVEKPVALALVVAVVGSYGACYTRMEIGPIRQGVGSPEATALFDFVRTQTHPDDVFLFQKPRALALFTGRRASGHHVPPSDEQMWHYLRQIHATYVVDTAQFPSSHRILGSFIARNADRFDTVFQKGDITVYRINENQRASR
jgi:4-amino-4-deoxy-L-arabinose transferase-like glycosyltransferase